MEATQFLSEYKNGEHELIVDPNHYIFYAMPQYLAYPKNQPDIEKRITYGLKKLYDSGELQKITASHFAYINNAFNRKAHIFVLNNPYLSPSQNDNIYNDTATQYFNDGAIIHRVPSASPSPSPSEHNGQ